MNEEREYQYHDYLIRPHHAGFGMYAAEKINDEDWWADQTDLLHEIARNWEIWEIGVDELPEGAEDIRGKIYASVNSSYEDRIFVGRQPDDEDNRTMHYFGIASKES